MSQHSFRDREALNERASNRRTRQLLAQMTLAEKLGQLQQVNGGAGVRETVREGRAGSVINEVNVEEVNELQRIAVQESRLGIPLLIGRDVIHGFKTIFPIPLGQAASWDPDTIARAAAIAAAEARSSGINWTFAPMIDISRDPRWGRIAESLGEDPHLCSVLGAAMVRGFQGEGLEEPHSIAACAKHFAGYGAVESGMDYNTTNIPEIELRNVYLPPFRAAVAAGVASLMSSFSDLNGVPCSGNRFLFKQVLRDEWNFRGLVVSDWESIKELTVHGFAVDDRAAARAAADVGIDMEMASSLYAEQLPGLIAEGRIGEQQIDEMVSHILELKFRLGLFENPYTDPGKFAPPLCQQHQQTARELAMRSCVLLKNEDQTLPLSASRLSSLAVIGPLADDGYEQLGTWVFDGEAQHSHTCLQALHAAVGDQLELRWAQGMENSRCRSGHGFDDAVNVARTADAVVMFMGEESILSGEAHCRADIGLPGNQEQLIEAVAATGTPIVLVVMAGRPLTLSTVIDKVAAVLYAWHPGTMAGPAITDLLFGVESPSGKLPVSFPRMVGQVPIYYARKNSGRPAGQHNVTHIDDIDGKATQTSLGMSAFHLDAGFTPLFPFGYGLSYAHFEYSELLLSAKQVAAGGELVVSATISNAGNCEAEEVVQLYVRDLVGDVTRPVKELKNFQRIRLAPGESRSLDFTLRSQDLAFYNQDMELVSEPGMFHVWIGGSSDAQLWGEFELLEAAG